MNLRLIPTGLFILFTLSGFLSAYSQKIYGKITDEKGVPIPYASVFIKNTNEGVSTNIEGIYSLSAVLGNVTIVCQHINYRKQEKTISVKTAEEVEVDFTLQLQEVELSEVTIKSGEDYAYSIIREAIKKRKTYQQEYQRFYAEVYTKGQMRLRNYPTKLFGQEVDFEDGDTSKRKMLFLSETVSQYSVDKPDKIKVEVISSKVSGSSDGYGLSAPTIFSLYDNLIMVGEQLNPRGFVSPIADNALQFYRYKYLGTFVEDGKEISKVRIMPKRSYEPLCSGIISIVEDEWRIHSTDILFTKSQSQLQLLDSLQLQQLYRPLDEDRWVIASQIVLPSVKFMGFDAYGSFVNVYTLFDLDPKFAKNYFNNTILKYVYGANKKDSLYWNEHRPIPLREDEIADYRKKDSLEIVRSTPHYLDSIDRVRNKLKPGALLFGYTYQKQRYRYSLHIPAVIGSVNFNPVEGVVIDAPIRWQKRIDSTFLGARSISLTLGLRYGFLNGHFNPNLTAAYHFGKKASHSITLSGGRNVYQFNNYGTIEPGGNTLTTLFGKNNQMKIYEAAFVKASYVTELGNGLWGTASVSFQDREPLENSTNFSFNKSKKNIPYTPNYPYEIMTENIKRHRATVASVELSWQPHSRYIEFPDRKINIGSKYPVFTFRYDQGINGWLGSRADFGKWKLSVKDDVNLKLQGIFSYRVGIGGFAYKNYVDVPDYMHFNGNRSVTALSFSNTFQVLPVYRFSNTANFYSLAHIEHNLKGALTNKIPGLRKLNLYLVWGANGFYIDKNANYFELFMGLDNIFKQLRVDFVHGFINGKTHTSAFRLGLSRGSFISKPQR